MKWWRKVDTHAHAFKMVALEASSSGIWNLWKSLCVSVVSSISKGSEMTADLSKIKLRIQGPRILGAHGIR